MHSFHALELISPSLADSLYKRAANAAESDWWREKNTVQWRISLESDTFKDYPLTQEIIDRFGDGERIFIQRLEAKTNYVWHVDYLRDAALNIGLNVFEQSLTMYGRLERSNFKELDPLYYAPRTVYLIDTSKPHCGLNFSDEDRYLVSISVVRPHTFRDVLQFVSGSK